MVVKNMRSAVNMDFRCSTGPFRIPNDPINVNEPHVKESANFCGFNPIIGKPTKKASAKNRAERKRSAQKTWTT